MVFSSVTFLLIFLPVTVLLYYIPLLFTSKKKDVEPSSSLITYKNTILCLASLVFYAWGEPVNILLMLLSILFNYCIGLDMQKHNDKKGHKRFLLVFAVLFDLGMLAFFKYSGFVAENIELIGGIKLGFKGPVLPIGISFYTFQILSYVIDVYKEKVEAQTKLLDFALYISMFPQLIAGPIVQYTTIDTQLRNRKESLAKTADGVYLFVLGLAKKVVLANTAGALYEDLLAKEFDSLTVLGAWSAVIFYAFQIYFDFSGYSDMAKGLGFMFGFEFPENFNYPYIADSVTDFWRRWHITLSAWFRDYVYIPLGGNRCSKARNIFNLFVVWALTGLWHGASWNFVLWGIYYFILLTLEKHVFAKVIEKMPKVIRHVITLLFVLFGWVLFSCTDLQDVVSMFSGMFGMHGLTDGMSIYVLVSNAVMACIMAVFSTPLFGFKNDRKTNKGYAFRLVLTVLLFGISIVCLIGDTYNPFLYFRF